MDSAACNVARNTSSWVCASPGGPTVRPIGWATAAIRGAPTEAVKSGIGDRQIVGIPAASMTRCTSPTDRAQIGQTGTMIARSTSSSTISAATAGAVSSTSSAGRRMNPIME